MTAVNEGKVSLIEPVIVTRHSAWHDLYTVYQRQEGTYRSTDFKDTRIVNQMDTIYWSIIRAIDPNHELLERWEQLAVHKTLTPRIDGWAQLAQQSAATNFGGREAESGEEVIVADPRPAA